MKRLAVLTLAAALVLTLAAGAWAFPFPITDVRALGMGGAFVAAGEGIGAVQHNPALLGEDTTMSVVLPNLTVRIEDHIGMIDLIDDYNNASGATSNQDRIDILSNISGESVDIMGNTGIGAGFGAFGLSMGFTYSDMVFGTVYASNITATLLTQDATIEFNGIQAKQIILSGAKTLGPVTVGGNLRNIDATVYYYNENIADNPDIGVGDLTKGDESSESAVAMDVGLFMAALPMVDVGIMARDLNSPKLGDMEFEPMYRVGAAIKLPTITIAADFDVSENTLEGGSDYQEWAIGAEFDLWAIALRAGVSNNSGLSGAPTLTHIGLGLGFMDLGFAYAEKGDYYIAGLNLGFGL
ncbi:MAG: conjugal transfer protein TraF [bacterium]|nr:conjugal transfer protein TraF [bacterium]